MIAITLDRAQFDAALDKLGDRVNDGTIPLSRLDRAVKFKMVDAVNKNAKATGGTVRGEDWAGFAPQYTRKDGTVVPAWGGVQRADGTGTVQGKLRPSGTRISTSSIPTRDQGQYTGTLLSSPPQIRNKNELMIGGAEQLTEHGVYQNAMRKLVKWDLPGDQTLADNIGAEWLNEIVADANKAGR